MVIVALGAPGTPVICCARAGNSPSKVLAMHAQIMSLSRFIFEFLLESRFRNSAIVSGIPTWNRSAAAHCRRRLYTRVCRSYEANVTVVSGGHGCQWRRMRHVRIRFLK
jgi:hypothetical protein